MQCEKFPGSSLLTRFCAFFERILCVPYVLLLSVAGEAMKN